MARGCNCDPNDCGASKGHRNEHAFMRALMLRLGAIGGLRIWRQNSGVVRVGSGYVNLAPAGAADITGIGPRGRRIEIETKAVGGKQSEDQKRWERMIRDLGGVYVLCCESEGVEQCAGRVLAALE